MNFVYVKYSSFWTKHLLKNKKLFILLRGIDEVSKQSLISFGIFFKKKKLGLSSTLREKCPY